MRPWRRARRRAATADRCGPAARGRRRRVLSAGAPGWESVNSTTSWPAAASAWLNPSTWAATPPTDRGGNSQVSIRTRIGRTLTRPPVRRGICRRRSTSRPARDANLAGRWSPARLRPVVTASLDARRGGRRVRGGVRRRRRRGGGSVAQACVMSLLVFTGASQFSAVSVIAAGGSTAAALGGGDAPRRPQRRLRAGDVADHPRLAGRAGSSPPS